MKAMPNIPGYDILSCLGGGSLSSVYAARDLTNDSTCAVKLLRPDWRADPVAIKLLQREARAALAVSHPHLVKVRHAHVLKPPYFLDMELLSGESLRRRLRRDYQLDFGTALLIARQTAEALAALHHKGFVHADVKPDNLRLDTDGSAILLDLGFAHHPGENASLLEEGYILGTVNYLAPELCGSQPVDDPRGDVFSLGVTLFEMLTGQLPFPQGGAIETLQRHRDEKPIPLGKVKPEAPAALAGLLDRLLARRPEDRPSSAALVQQLVALEISALGLRRAA